ncbi:hypothetical protein MTO96_000237 [Rhipicephalus appendiculatus]
MAKTHCHDVNSLREFRGKYSLQGRMSGILKHSYISNFFYPQHTPNILLLQFERNDKSELIHAILRYFIDYFHLSWLYFWHILNLKAHTKILEHKFHVMPLIQNRKKRKRNAISNLHCNKQPGSQVASMPGKKNVVYSQHWHQILPPTPISFWCRTQNLVHFITSDENVTRVPTLDNANMFEQCLSSLTTRSLQLATFLYF